MHTYLLVFVQSPMNDENFGKIHDKLSAYKAHELVNPMSWLLQSNKTAQEIYQDFRPLFPEKFLFVTEINLEHSAGYLWDGCCNWIKSRLQQPCLEELDIRK